MYKIKSKNQICSGNTYQEKFAYYGCQMLIYHVKSPKNGSKCSSFLFPLTRPGEGGFWSGFECRLLVSQVYWADLRASERSDFLTGNEVVDAKKKKTAVHVLVFLSLSCSLL